MGVSTLINNTTMISIHLQLHLRGSSLGQQVIQQILDAGHVSLFEDKKGEASFVVGIPSSPWGNIPANKRIVLVNPGSFEDVPNGVILFNGLNFDRIGGPRGSFLDFLKSQK